MDPILLPNWDTLSLKKLSLSRWSNNFSYTSQLDFGGIGPKDVTTGAKHSVVANFNARRPCLPFYVDCGRDLFSYASNNCLAACQHKGQDLLLFSHQNKITGLTLEDNQSIDRGSAEKSDLTTSHRYSSERTVNYGPFRYRTEDVIELLVGDKDPERVKPVLELKVNKCDYDDTHIQTVSRNKISFYGFTDEEEFGLSLDNVCDVDIEVLRRSDDSMFDNCDRNELLNNELLISYSKDDVIDLYDLETTKTIRSFDSHSFAQNSRDQTGLNWSEGHPQMFFYGEFKKLLYCDARQLRPANQLLGFNKCDNLFNWELFYKFLPSKLNPHQVFLSTDYHVVLVDHRYPKRSLTQFKHMLPKQIIRCIDSSLTDCEGTETEVTITTNFYRNCLMSFTSEPNIVQLSSNHLPLHFANIDDIDFYQFRNCYYRGIKVLKRNDGFSVALLSNIGDIFIEDFYWNNRVIAERRSTEVTWSKGIGSSDLKDDRQTSEYMSIVNKFVEQHKCEQVKGFRRTDDECLHCLVLKQSQRKSKKGSKEPKRLTAFPPEEEKVPQDKKQEDLEYEKHFGEGFLEVKKLIDDGKLCDNLWEQSEDLSKKLYSVWVEGEQVTVGDTTDIIAMDVD